MQELCQRYFIHFLPIVWFWPAVCAAIWLKLNNSHNNKSINKSMAAPHTSHRGTRSSNASVLSCKISYIFLDLQPAIGPDPAS